MLLLHHAVCIYSVPHVFWSSNNGESTLTFSSCVFSRVFKDLIVLPLGWRCVVEGFTFSILCTFHTPLCEGEGNVYFFLDCFRVLQWPQNCQWRCLSRSFGLLCDWTLVEATVWSFRLMSLPPFFLKANGDILEIVGVEQRLNGLVFFLCIFSSVALLEVCQSARHRSKSPEKWFIAHQATCRCCWEARQHLLRFSAVSAIQP